MDMAKPKIRFKGYQEDWEQRKFGEIASSFEYGLNVAAKEYDGENKYIRITDIDDNTHKFLSDSLTSPDIDLTGAENYKLAKGDILFARTGASVGKSYIYRDYDGLVYYAGFLIRARIRDEYDAEFVFQNTLTDKYNKYIAVTSQRSGQPGVNAQEYSEFKIQVPKKEEQIKIGKYFQNLDHLITLHQRKCDQTKKLKKFMLQKMFPQNGKKVPELRFSEFTDDWEQRKLGEVAKEFKSGNSLKADEIGITGDYPVYGGNGLRGYTSTYNHDGEFALIGRQGALCGNMNYSVGKAYFTEHAVVVKADENNDTKFMYYMLDTMNLGQYSDQSAQPGLAVNKLVKLENLFPQKEEQQRIGLYFSNVDHLITLHQRKYEELQKVKKFMLQNMFV